MGSVAASAGAAKGETSILRDKLRIRMAEKAIFLIFIAFLLRKSNWMGWKDGLADSSWS
jgi:hypothetical protein